MVVVVVLFDPLWPCAVVVVVEDRAAVVVVVDGAPAAAVVGVVGVVVGVVVGALLGALLTLGRVPTSTRSATAATKTARTTAARTTDSEADMPVCGRSSSIGGPACPAPPLGASLSAGRARDRGRRPVVWGRARVAQSVEHFTCNALVDLPRRTV